METRCVLHRTSEASRMWRNTHLASILRQLVHVVGNTEKHLDNTIDFANKVQQLKVLPMEDLVPYDVTALFTVPVSE